MLLYRNLHSGFPCYANTELGIGFTGISLLRKKIPSCVVCHSNNNNSIRYTEEEIVVSEDDLLTISITLRSSQADGLIMLLTMENQSEAIFAAGLRNGRVCGEISVLHTN